MDELVAIIHEHAVKHNMERVINELQLNNKRKFSLPDSWACVQVLEEFYKRFGEEKTDIRDMDMVRKLLVDLASFSTNRLFQHITPMDYGILVNYLGCLIAARLLQQGNPQSNQKVLDIYVPKWTEEFWNKTRSRFFRFSKKTVLEKEAFNRFYVHQRSCLLTLTESIAQQKKIVGNLTAMFLSQMSKVFPELIKYVKSSRPSTLEKIICSKKLSETARPDLRFVQKKLQGREVTEAALLELLSELAAFLSSRDFRKHVELVKGALDVSNDDSTSTNLPEFTATFATATTTEVQAKSTHSIDGSCIPVFITLNIGGQQKTFEVSRQQLVSESGKIFDNCLSRAPIVKQETENLYSNHEEPVPIPNSPSRLRRTEDIVELRKALQSLQEQHDKLDTSQYPEIITVKEKLRQLTGL